MNKRVADIHPTVPNLYNLLSSLPPDRTWYTVLDLKDAFFCLRLSPKSQPIFTFEWKDPEASILGQLTWTRLPQGFKNSPTIFDEALHQDLAMFKALNPQVMLLQYIDDLLLAAPDEQTCVRGTRRLLQELGAWDTKHLLRRLRSARNRSVTWDTCWREENTGSRKPENRLCSTSRHSKVLNK